MRRVSIISIFILSLVTMAVSCQRRTATLQPCKSILVLTQQEMGTQIYASLENAFNNELADTNRYKLEFCFTDMASHIRILDKEYFHDARPYLSKALDKIEQSPDLIIIVGQNIAHSAAMSDHPMLQKTPVLCLDVTDAEWKGLLRKRKNFVVMEAKPAVKENVDFIRALGGSSWIVTVLDSTYIDDYLRQSIMETMGRDTLHYITNLNLETYPRLMVTEYRDTVRSTLIPVNMEHAMLSDVDTIHNRYYRLSGLLHTRNNDCNFLRLKDDAYIDYSLSHNLGAYYSQTPLYFNLPLQSALNACMGGYFTPFPEMMRQAHPIIDRLLRGENPASIPWTPLKKDYWLDWRLARQMHPYAEDFPDYVHFVNLPWREESRLNDDIYNKWLPVTVALIVFIVIAVPVYFGYRSRRQRNALVRQGKKADANRQKIESVMAATRSYNWELLPDDTILLCEDFARKFSVSGRIVPLERMLELHHQPGRNQLREALFDTTKERYQVPVLVDIPATGETHAFISYINHIKDQDGTMRCIGFTIINDEEYEVEKKRREAFHLSEETSVKESFLAAMSHEIRAPLNAIVGFADILVSQNHLLTDEERTAYGKYINDSKDQLIKLLDDVMSFSDKNRDALSLELSRKSVQKLMDEVYYMHTVIVPKHLEFKYQHGDDAIIMTNRSAVLQIMSNLINNAIKFTRKGSITLGWEVIENTDGKAVIMYVEDTGMGIAPENLERVFDEYFKTDSHTIGAGIGLPLCKRLAESMNASIYVTSTLGKGSRFNLKINIDK